MNYGSGPHRVAMGHATPNHLGSQKLWQVQGAHGGRGSVRGDQWVDGQVSELVGGPSKSANGMFGVTSIRVQAFVLHFRRFSVLATFGK